MLVDTIPSVSICLPLASIRDLAREADYPAITFGALLCYRPAGAGLREAVELAEWLDSKFKFTHFITLASNDQSLGEERLRDLLKEWDARLNRDLKGPKWRKHHDELTYWFAFLEKPQRNPHWHLLFRPDYFDHLVPDPRVTRLQEAVLFHWKRLIPSGSVSVKEIRGGHDRVTDYVVKELGYEVQYESWIVPDDFRPR